MDLKKKVADHIRRYSLIESGDKVIVGVSGGADSLSLLFLLDALKKDDAFDRDFELIAVHVHHGIRGESADGDAMYSKEVCEGLGIPFALRYVDVPRLAAESGETIEEAARRARYECFREIAGSSFSSEQTHNQNTGSSFSSEQNHNQNTGSSFSSVAKKTAYRKPDGVRVAVGHHQNDQSETVLHNLFRGTALKGLSGMQPRSERDGMTIIRPLLTVTRDEIEEYLSSMGVRWRTDETNLSDEYTRNKIRHIILPAACSINSAAVSNIARAAYQASLAQDYITSKIEEAAKEYARRDGGRAVLDIGIFDKEHEVISSGVIRLCIEHTAGRLKDITEGHISDVAGMRALPSGRSIDLPYAVMVRREYDSLIFMRKDEEIKGYETRLRSFEREETGEPVDFPKDSCVKWFDCDKINGCVVFRHRCEGDFIITAAGRIKLKEFFIKQKVPVSERERAVLLAREESGEVLWVYAGAVSRVNVKYLTDENTKRILEARIDERQDKRADLGG